MTDDAPTPRKKTKKAITDCSCENKSRKRQESVCTRRTKPVKGVTGEEWRTSPPALDGGGKGFERGFKGQ